MTEDREFSVDPFVKVYGRRKGPREEGRNDNGEGALGAGGDLRDEGLTSGVKASTVVASDGGGEDDVGMRVSGEGEEGKSNDDIVSGEVVRSVERGIIGGSVSEERVAEDETDRGVSVLVVERQLLVVKREGLITVIGQWWGVLMVAVVVLQKKVRAGV